MIYSASAWSYAKSYRMSQLLIFSALFTPRTPHGCVIMGAGWRHSCCVAELYLQGFLISTIPVKPLWLIHCKLFKIRFDSKYKLVPFHLLVSPGLSFPSVLSVVSGIFQKDVSQISRTSFWVTIKIILQTYKTCREVTFFFFFAYMEIWAFLPTQTTTTSASTDNGKNNVCSHYYSYLEF